MGPDNGLLLLVAMKERIQHVYVIKNLKSIQSKISKTFPGRDIFAPAAAYLAGGSEAAHLGDEIKDYVVLTYAKPRIEKGTVFGEILYIDSFGNLIMNISERLLNKIAASKDESLKIVIRGEVMFLKLSSTYSEVHVGSPLIIVGSHGYLEFSVNQGSAKKLYKAKVDDLIRVQSQSHS